MLLSNLHSLLSPDLNVKFNVKFNGDESHYANKVNRRVAVGSHDRRLFVSHKD